MRPILFILFLLISPFALQSQATGLQAIKEQSQKLSLGLVNGKYSDILDHTHPAIIEKAGGRQAIEDIIKMSSKQMESMGVTVDKIEIGDDIIINRFSENEYHCLVPKTMTMTIEGKKMKQLSYIFGWSDKAQEKWVFVEATQLKDGIAEQFIPGFKTNIEIPENGEPDFSEN